MKEEVVVKSIEKQLLLASRYYNNLHGSMLSKNGSPDFVTMDANGVYTGIEAKAPKKTPYVNQWRRCIEILLSGGRFIVAQEDFNLQDMDNNHLPIIRIGGIVGESEFEMDKQKIHGTHEIKLKD